jgi:regulator of replication initiation timing
MTTPITPAELAEMRARANARWQIIETSPNKEALRLWAKDKTKAIFRLLDEVERLQSEYSNLKGYLDEIQEGDLATALGLPSLERENERLRAENVRLREALGQIKKDIPTPQYLGLFRMSLIDDDLYREGHHYFAVELPALIEEALGKELTEKGGEVLAAAGKSIRWGLDSVNPELPPEE